VQDRQPLGLLIIGVPHPDPSDVDGEQDERATPASTEAEPEQLSEPIQTTTAGVDYHEQRSGRGRAWSR
jgi:hypothetical protein